MSIESVELEEDPVIKTFAPEGIAEDGTVNTVPLNDLQERTNNAATTSLETASLFPSSVLDELDRIIDEMEKTDTSQMNIDQILELVNKVCSAAFQNQKKITTKVAQQAEEARKEHLKIQLGEYRGYSVMAVSAGTGLLHFAGASAGFARTDATANLFKSAAAYAPATTQAQGILQQRQQGNIAEHSTETEASKLEKQELDQAKSADGNHIDGAKQKEDARERSRHELILALLRA